MAVMSGVKVKEIAYAGEDPSSTLTGKRNTYFRDLGGFVETPICRGNTLAYGNRIAAPATIEGPTTMIVLFPESEATITRFGNYLIDVG